MQTSDIRRAAHTSAYVYTDIYRQTEPSHVHRRALKSTPVYTAIHTHPHLHIYAKPCIDTHTYRQIHNIRVCLYVCMYMYVCMHVCQCTYACYMNTHVEDRCVRGCMWLWVSSWVRLSVHEERMHGVDVRVYLHTGRDSSVRGVAVDTGQQEEATPQQMLKIHPPQFPPALSARVLTGFSSFRPMPQT